MRLWMPMLPSPVCPLAGHSTFGQNGVCGSMAHLLSASSTERVPRSAHVFKFLGLHRLAYTYLWREQGEGGLQERYHWFILTEQGAQLNQATRRANGDTRVAARGTSCTQATPRRILLATALRMGWTWVFAGPIERERRSPTVRTPCDHVCSLPARPAYSS